MANIVSEESIWALICKASIVKNAITINSMPLLFLPCLIYLILGMKTHGIYDQIASVASIKRAFLMLNGSLMFLEAGLRLLGGGLNWNFHNGACRYLMIFTCIHPIAIWLACVYVNPSLTLSSHSSTNVSTIGSLFLFMSGIYLLVSTPITFFLQANINGFIFKEQWSITKVLTVFFMHMITALILLLLITSMVRNNSYR